MRIADWARENNALRALLQKCGNRCHVVDNRYWGDQEIYRNNQNQVRDLLNTIDLAVAANSGKTDTRRIVFLGKTGSGKSSLANMIFRDDHVFTVNHSPNSGTSVCKSVTRKVHGRVLTLIDTPGLFDTDPNSSAFSSEIMHLLEECAPGPHAFLLVLKVEKYTAQEQAVVHLILKYFSPKALRYTTVVFTHGDNLPPV
uniref:AIG1-type G domain-containing protein n=1 Tax=Neogobius melanostomus TaxID=47308 RepID=A0A8C6UGW4_9GOBI